MKDLSGRFALSEGERKAEASPNLLARLQQSALDDQDVQGNARGRRLDALRGRADLLAAASALLVVALVLWPLLHKAVVSLPPIAQTGDEVAVLTVQPLMDGGIATAPDWNGLFNAYQLETSLRDISIRCNYGLETDARVDRYLHARLTAGTQVRVFLADPGKCPKP